MFRGDRGERNPHLGAYGILLAIFLCTIIAGVLSYSSGRESERRDNAPASYSRAAKQDAQRACVGMETGTTFECIYEKVEASQEQARGEQDLSAQQRAATSALVTAILSGIALILSGVGVWFIKGTLDATLEAVKETGNANKIARESFALENRAVLYLGELQVKSVQWIAAKSPVEAFLFIEAAIEIINAGKMPGRYSIRFECKPGAHADFSKEFNDWGVSGVANSSAFIAPQGSNQPQAVTSTLQFQTLPAYVSIGISVVYESGIGEDVHQTASVFLIGHKIAFGVMQQMSLQKPGAYSAAALRMPGEQMAQPKNLQNCGQKDFGALAT